MKKFPAVANQELPAAPSLDPSAAEGDAELLSGAEMMLSASSGCFWCPLRAGAVPQGPCPLLCTCYVASRHKMSLWALQKFYIEKKKTQTKPTRQNLCRNSVSSCLFFLFVLFREGFVCSTGWCGGFYTLVTKETPGRAEPAGIGIPEVLGGSPSGLRQHRGIIKHFILSFHIERHIPIAWVPGTPINPKLIVAELIKLMRTQGLKSPRVWMLDLHPRILIKN